MKTIKVVIIAAALCCSAVFALKSAAKPQPVVAQKEATYTGIPAGFDFPADQATLLRFRDNNDIDAMRKHTWMVFAGMTQPAKNGEAIWETWYSSTETFQTGAGPQGIRSLQRKFQTPRQFKTGDGAAIQAAGASLLSFVLFNQEGRAHIRNNQFNLRSRLEEINNGFPPGTDVAKREITPFPVNAVSIKTVWWVVKETGLTAMPIWDNQPTKPDEQGNDYPDWARAVAVDPTRTTIPEDEKRDVFFNGVLRKNSHVVPLSKFYGFKITENEIEAVRNSGAPNAADAQIGDYAVLIAFHFTTKEIPDWIWATLWWHDKPNDGPFAANRTKEVPGVWRNYLMDVTFSTDTPKEGDGTPNIAFNPWLEARFPNGMKSNCMTCHQRAVWRPASFLPVTRGGLPANDPFFTNKTKLDFLWSIAFESR